MARRLDGGVILFVDVFQSRGGNNVVDVFFFIVNSLFLV